jgi:hypothetical protein
MDNTPESSDINKSNGISHKRKRDVTDKGVTSGESESNALDDPHKIKQISDAASSILEALGEDPRREGLLKTPERMAQALLFFTKGYSTNLQGMFACTLITRCVVVYPFIMSFRVDQWCCIQ